jgi:hypothetical protein
MIVIKYKPVQIGVDVLGFPVYWMMPYYSETKSKHSKT